MLTIEIAKQPPTYKCACCGSTTHAAHGFLHKDEVAYGVYFSRWTLDGPHPGISVAISLGEWADNADSTGRRSVTFSTPLPRATDFDIVDPTYSPWGNKAILGPMLPASHFETHPWKPEFRDALDFVLQHDPRLSAAIRGTTVSH